MLEQLRLFCARLLRHTPFISIIPDESYIRLMYSLTTGKNLDLGNPQLFKEKIQWLKLYNRNPLFTQMVDKYSVKAYVAERIGKKYVIPNLGVWDKFSEIDFNTLPEKFVLKTTHGGGSCGVVVCSDRNKFDRKTAEKKIRKSLSQDIYWNFREWPYRDVPKRIIAEQYIESGNSDLTDYKVFCFNGEPKFIQVIQNRSIRETIDFFDTVWKHQEFVGLTPNVRNSEKSIPRPARLNEMLEIAATLSYGIPFLRVDLYVVNDNIYFGELTFFPASGLGTFTPDIWDLRLGQMLELPSLHSFGAQ